jgi:hyperosmotically inducible periplasmic protein
MKITKMLMAVAILLTLGFAGCKPKDADIKANVENALKANPDAGGVTVTVIDGVATISGDVKDDATKSAVEAAAKTAKGVKNVVNNTTVPAPVATVPEPASVTTVLDAATQQKVKDGLKDIKGVTVTFTADKAVLAGEVNAKDNMKIQQMLGAANVKSANNGITR